MPQFQYIAKLHNGALQVGQVAANSRREALAWLTQQALFPIKVEEVNERAATARRIPGSALAAMYELLGDLLESGVPLLKALDIQVEQTAHAGLRETLRTIRTQVADGRSLAAALRDHPSAFSSLAVSMIHAGEEGGFLEDSLRRIAKFTERTEELRGKVVAALAYPAFLLATGLIVVTGMLAFFVPKFEPLFARLRDKGELPWPTTVLLTTSDLVRHHGVWLFVIGLLVVMAAKHAWRQESVQLWWDGLQIRLPSWGPIARHLAIARFARVLGTLMRNGVPMLKSLMIAKDATGNRVLSAAIARAAENVSYGKTLAEPLRACGQFPREILEMISVAEQANRLEVVLVDLAEKLELKVHRRLDVFMKLLEPSLMLVMAVLVGFLVVALLLPVFEGSGGLN